MKMLLYKAWIETRVRFVASLIAASIVCIYYMNVHAWQVARWSQELANPRGYHFTWMPLGIHEYGWYLWHYLYENYLQQVWTVFAALFAFGGLIREKSSGTVLFSLGLPVSRRRWLMTRLLMALIESIALSLFAVAIIFAGSSVIHQSYSHAQVLLHTALMVGGGFFLIALGNLCFTLFPGEYLSLILTVTILGVPYLLIQTYMQHMRYLGRAPWLRIFDISHAMSGPWQLTFSTTPWAALSLTWLLAAGLIAAAAIHGDRIDY
jgi:ABC-type transport system involved in multi-copper enzyme maturation permease subunit